MKRYIRQAAVFLGASAILAAAIASIDQRAHEQFPVYLVLLGYLSAGAILLGALVLLAFVLDRMVKK
jgi:hypothetical protein